MSNKIKGKYGEEAAVNFLINKGYKIIERNFHFSRYGEIDVIAKNKDTTCFVEVKTRTSDAFGAPFEAITKTKLDKILKSAYGYLLKNPKASKKIRVEAVSVILDKEDLTKVIEINHLENIEF